MFSGQARCSEVKAICEHGAPMLTSLRPCLLHMWSCCVLVSGRSSWLREGLLTYVFVVSWFLGGSPAGLRTISCTYVCYAFGLP